MRRLASRTRTSKPVHLEEATHAYLRIPISIFSRGEEDLGDTPVGACSCSGGFGRAFEVACREGSIRAGLRVAPVILRASRRVIRRRSVQVSEAGQLGAAASMRLGAVLLRAWRRDLQCEKMQVCAAVPSSASVRQDMQGGLPGLRNFEHSGDPGADRVRP
jgi:hypothetical protein